MIIVNVKGGIGNQMFQYSIYRRLKEEGKTVRLWSVYPYMIDVAFDAKGEFASRREAQETGLPATVSKNYPLRWAAHRLLRPKRKPNQFADDKGVYVFSQDIENRLQSDPPAGIFLDGYWQNEKWFSSIRGIIQREFSFKNALDERNSALLEKISRGGARSVAVHVRRYSSQGFGGIDKGIDYYEKAIRYFSDRLENAVYYIFSDDIAYCKANIRTPQSVFVEGNPSGPWEPGQWKDMMLMSRCQNIVISNSTYSWWAAYLNPDDIKKNVAAPAFWLAEQGDTNPNLEEWAVF
ncbi:MAG: alpha-1,2-fucosyltransferase [Clostridiales Family XIII bacterium]|jgi:hypothetical protein|nr:alpha-1,2-fucosyltransferase [Clostridiales Family XIII bacterium]